MDLIFTKLMLHVRSMQVFILIEHPVERDKLETLQGLLLTERENFLGLVSGSRAHRLTNIIIGL